MASAALLLFVLPLALAGRPPNASADPGAERTTGWILLLDVAALLCGVWLAGLPIASALFVALYTALRFRLAWRKALVAGIAVALFEWGLFDRWLEIPLDAGLLQRLL